MDSGTVEGLFRMFRYTADNKQNMEEMYEVLKFVEHGMRCRQGMDCVRGSMLLDYLRDSPDIDKSTFFMWIRDIAVSLDQYHRSHNRQNYRYLNPCSIIVSEEKEIFLLDIAAADNEAAMKRMQSRAVRNHFVKPLYELGVAKNNDADLFAYGRTIQFMIAYPDIRPALSRREVRCLSGVIRHCTGEKGRKYEEFRQVLRDLPSVPKQRKQPAERGCGGSGRKRMSVIAAACAGICLFLGIRGQETGNEEGMLQKKESYPQPVRVEEKGGGPSEKNIAETAEMLQKAVRFAVTAVENLGEALEDRKHEDEMISVYGRIMELETEKKRITEAGLKKMELEMQRGEFEQALDTAKVISEKTGKSEKVTALIERCKNQTDKVP